MTFKARAITTSTFSFPQLCSREILKHEGNIIQIIDGDRKGEHGSYILSHPCRQGMPQ